jgi:hydroxyethylthiazole kinase-like uncharacterized protein yjeF
MNGPSNQVLSVAQMRAAEAALVDRGTGVDALMLLAGQGAAEWVFRLAWPRPVTVLCGPGNNGGDGYVIAESLRQRGLEVAVVAPLEPTTDAARNARGAFQGPVLTGPGGRHGGTLVDCLFGSGLTRPLLDDLLALLQGLAASHSHRVAVDVPSGVESDSGQELNADLPDYDLTIALGAWKFAHWLMPASAKMGMRKLVSIGVEEVPGAAQLLARPKLTAPHAEAHKYTRGLAVVVAGAMQGAALLASAAATRGGAGYVKLDSNDPPEEVSADLVVEAGAMQDTRADALLVGCGLGRDAAARAKLSESLARNLPLVLDGDALVLLGPEKLAAHSAVRILTPHGGELAALAKSFGESATGKLAMARELAEATGAVVIAKGPDTLITAPDGRTTLAPPTPSWLSTAGTGDILAGLAVSRLAAGSEPFDAACEAVWLHGEAARLAGPDFTPDDLIHEISTAYSACL